jgi:hypothetical protein
MAPYWFTGGGRPRVSLHALFQAQAGTRVEPPTFVKRFFVNGKFQS